MFTTDDNLIKAIVQRDFVDFNDQLSAQLNDKKYQVMRDAFKQVGDVYFSNRNEEESA